MICGDTVMKPPLMVFLGAGLGAVLRFWIGTLLQSRSTTEFPIGTLVVNLSGCAAIGVLMALAIRFEWAPEARLFLVTGLLGGYTTFSSFGYETIQLLVNKQVGQAALYVCLSNAFGIGLCALSLRLTSLFISKLS